MTRIHLQEQVGVEPEIKKTLHAERSYARCDDGESKVGVIGDKNVIRPGVRNYNKPAKSWSFLDTKKNEE
jgi:hypothetical protein